MICGGVSLKPTRRDVSSKERDSPSTNPSSIAWVGVRPAAQVNLFATFPSFAFHFGIFGVAHQVVFGGIANPAGFPILVPIND